MSIGACFYCPVLPRRAWILGAVCSILPDLDVLGFRYGIRYGDFWGHCGFTHSLLFAAFAALAALLLGFWKELSSIRKFYLWTYLFLATASHGALDAMTDGGLGVAFFSPFDTGRYFLPWRPIHVSPIAIGRFFTHGGLAIFQNELLWIWLPATLLAAAALFLRRHTSEPSSTAASSES